MEERMKFATLQHDGRERVALIVPETDSIYPLDAVDMVDLIERFDSLRPSLPSEGSALRLSEVHLLAPVPRPRRNIFCVGKNYREHAEEFSRSGYEAGAQANAEPDAYPAVFTKPGSCVVGPDATVPTHPNVTSAVDYEGELAVIIGRAGKDIARADAMDHVWGYSIVNDVTARDRQMNHRQWFLGKALDGFCPMGPWLTTSDEVVGASLQIQTWVNGELRQDTNTRDLIFDIPSLIAIISGGLTLLPGDILATGTPKGVGIGFDPPRFLRAGDIVKISIAGLGSLSNVFI
jgi:2-keto-4-pentenoate hydratase/2-oxohepta-3-ene-1,7-dioic acid hydratase in catechol pathway